jgi:undecaprenyl diphosphate synthase
MSSINSIDRSKLPIHVAIIMDGNGRWAKKQGKPRVFGHQNGARAVRATIEISAELGIKYLTLYAFSAENWKRPQLEIEALMALLITTIDKELNNLLENNVRLKVIGNINLLPKSVRDKLNIAISKTSKCSGTTLILALSYSGRWEIVEAVKNICAATQANAITPKEVTDALIEQYLSTAGIPDPELLIRTSGELRLSNFLLWQTAYTELYFTNTLWPDFDKEEMIKALASYQSRERRFGKTTEQL